MQTHSSAILDSGPQDVGATKVWFWDIQGSAGDGFKYAAALLWERRRECPGNPKIVNLVHDEVVLEIDSEHVDAGKQWLEGNMLEGMREVLGPEAPVSVEITVADSWGEKK